MDYPDAFLWCWARHQTPATFVRKSQEKQTVCGHKGLLISDYSIRTKCCNPRLSHLLPPIHAAPARTIRFHSDDRPRSHDAPSSRIGGNLPIIRVGG
ncbi:hypothetical protein CDAR_108371 [Caerostris darwini]|uniref:Uncharacterized protein n=1 Tax=Caerostris darwini TaxID=1538125 RepID=A0AAV4PUA3_9ARAC|nr:hypothetical protein CDAR_108371 [Caerostris darwini]